MILNANTKEIKADHVSLNNHQTIYYQEEEEDEGLTSVPELFHSVKRKIGVMKDDISEVTKNFVTKTNEIYGSANDDDVISKESVISNNVIEKARLYKFKKEITNKKIISKIEEPPKVTDHYTKEELDLIYRVVEAEMGYCDTKEKSYVASVIFNMINHPDKKFGKSVKSVIKWPNRFCISRSHKISKSTKKAVQMAFAENTAPDCYAFHCMKKSRRFAGFTYKFSDKYGVHYYGE